MLVDFVIIGTILLIVIYVVTGLYWIRAGVPSVPTPVITARAMVTLARLKGHERVVDPAAGHGRILVEAKRMHPGITATGIEITPTVWLLGLFTILWSRQKVSLRCGDARNADFRNVDVVFLYVTNPLMAMFEEKFNRELRPGTVVVAHAFRFPQRKPDEVVAVESRGKIQTIARYTW